MCNNLKIRRENKPLDNSPAMLDFEAGEIVVNPSRFDHLPAIYQKFIIAHEQGHYCLGTLNELEADYYAFRQIAGTEKGSLQAMIDTLANVLPFHSGEHMHRLVTMYCHAMMFNYSHSGNEKYLTEILEIMSYYGFNIFDPLEIADVIDSELLSENEREPYQYLLLSDLKSAGFNESDQNRGTSFDYAEQPITEETTTSGPITGTEPTAPIGNDAPPVEIKVEPQPGQTPEQKKIKIPLLWLIAGVVALIALVVIIKQ
jgi:hypothetical protein